MEIVTLGKKKKHGFSFIEVMFVALIIGVLAALAFPSFRIQMLKVNFMPTGHFGGSQSLIQLRQYRPLLLCRP